MFPELVATANGGVILHFMGQLWFLLDPEMRAIMNELSGAQVPAQFAVQPAWCNSTPPAAPTLGGFGATSAMGLPEGYCHPQQAQPYGELWREAGRVWESRRLEAEAESLRWVEQWFSQHGPSQLR